jgi:cbb3-type cytochrome oxidase maturation protein
MEAEVNVIYFMIPVALLMAGGFVAACIWALGSGQFDDLETPAFRILKNDLVEKTKTIITERTDKEKFQ